MFCKTHYFWNWCLVNTYVETKNTDLCLIMWKELNPISYARNSMSYKTEVLLVLLSGV
jgi:hypothetical protein